MLRVFALRGRSESPVGHDPEGRTWGGRWDQAGPVSLSRLNLNRLRRPRRRVVDGEVQPGRPSRWKVGGGGPSPVLTPVWSLGSG